MNNLLSNIQVCKGSSQGRIITDGTTWFSAPVNLSHADGCLWIVFGNSQFGAASTLFVFPQYSSSTGGTFISLTSEGGIRTTGLAKAGLDEKIVLLDVVKPMQGTTISRPFVRLAGVGATGIHDVLALRYNLSERATTSYTSPSTFLGAAKILVSPTS